MKHDVFISYSSHDKQVANAICSKLENNKIRCWIAPRDILGGIEYGEAIVDAIADCNIFLLVFSSDANRSVFVRKEVERGLAKGKIIVPFRIEDTLPTNAMEFALSNTHWLDALTPPLEHHLALLTDTIFRLLKMKSSQQEQYPAYDASNLSISQEGNQQNKAVWLMKTTDGPGERINFVMGYDNNKEVTILHGGFGHGPEENRSIAISSLHLRSPELQDTWIWDGSAWNQLHNNRLMLKNHALAYNKNLQQNLIYGGSDNIQKQDHTYILTGEDWLKVTANHDSGPGRRENHSLVYDFKRKSILLFGGLIINIHDGQMALGDTWEWNGSVWKKLQVSSPQPRWGHKMIYDENRGMIILFGGYDGTNYFDDTWFWEGNTATWSKISTMNMPSARCNFGMAYNSIRKRVILFGGESLSGIPMNDLWEWDGNDWKLVIDHAPPKARFGHGFVYDIKRDKTVLYGGFDGKEFFRDTWEIMY